MELCSGQTPKARVELEIVYIEQLVPEDHLLRNVQRAVDLRFIVDKVRHFYSADNGRPSIDPVVLLKMLFIGYLFGISSERRLVQELEVNIAYRWFLGLKLTEPIPSVSAIWENRRSKWKGTEICQESSMRSSRQAIHHGLVDGKVLYSDSTHIKANANKRKFLLQQVPVSTRNYISEPDAAVEADRELDNRAVDGMHNFITDDHVTPGNVHDSVPYLSRLERQIATFGFEVASVALDAAYQTNTFDSLTEKGIFAVIGHRRFQSTKGLMPRWKFDYDRDASGGSMLTYRSTNREGHREYKSEPQICQGCLLRPLCTRSAAMQKTLTRHVWEDARERVRSNRLTPQGQSIYSRRKATIERSFADANGHRYARYRGLRLCASSACSRQQPTT